MADQKLTDLEVLADPATDDLTYVVDISAGLSGSKQLTLGEIGGVNAVPLAIADSSDVAAANGTLFNGTDHGFLAYKDSTGTVSELAQYYAGPVLIADSSDALAPTASMYHSTDQDALVHKTSAGDVDVLAILSTDPTPIYDSADAVAGDSTLYYSTDQNALVYKDADGNAAPISSATVYASPTGNDSTGDGSRDTPYQTLRAALTAVGPKGKVIALDGDYTYLATTSADSGTEANPTRIEAENKWSAKITGDGSNHAVRLLDSNYVEVSGFEITGLLDGVKVDATNCVVEGNWIHDTGGQGIQSPLNADDGTYRYNRIDKCGTGTQDHGIYNEGSGVKCHDNLVTGCSGQGLNFYNEAEGLRDCQIYRNMCFGNVVAPCNVYGPGLGDSCGNVIRDNYFDQSRGQAGHPCLRLNLCEQAEVLNNVLVVRDGQVTLEDGCLNTVYTGNVSYPQMADINTHGSYNVTDIVTNGGFETLGAGGDDVFTDWVNAVSSSTVTADNTEQDSGTYCCKWTMSGSTNVFITQDAVTTVGDVYTVTFRAKADASCSIMILDPNIAVSLTTTYQTYRITYVAEATYLRIGRSSATDRTIFIDNVTLEQAYGPTESDNVRCSPLT